jgi:hypothetical protein
MVSHHEPEKAIPRGADQPGARHRKGAARGQAGDVVTTMIKAVGVGLVVAVGSMLFEGPIRSSWATLTEAPQSLASREASVWYSGCNEARRAGVTPLYTGEPGYRSGMDGDGDGIACE